MLEGIAISFMLTLLLLIGMSFLAFAGVEPLSDGEIAIFMTLMLHHGMDTRFGLKLISEDTGVDFLLIMRSAILVFCLGFIVGSCVINTARSVAQSGLAADSTA